jgi:hypothetical protein
MSIRPPRLPAKMLSLSVTLVAIVAAGCSSSTFSSSPPPPATADAGDGGGGGNGSSCTAARNAHLGPISRVSTGQVKVISNVGGVTRIFVDASAGGPQGSARSPRVYIKLTGDKVELDDNAAFASADWDLALKRVDIFTNGGDAGPGKGGAKLLSKGFAAVSASDAEVASVPAEKFFDAECNGIRDEASFIVTTFSGWYNYTIGDGPSVKPGVSFAVLAADGTPYKLQIVSYTARPDGTPGGETSGLYLLEVARL